MSADRDNDAPAAAGAYTGNGASQPRAAYERARPAYNRRDAGGAGEPPLPYEDAPPLPDEPVPDQTDDGWDWRRSQDNTIFYINTKTGAWQWENPRIPEATTHNHVAYDRYPTSAVQVAGSGAPGTSSPPKPIRKWGGYNPKIHGSWDPKADYAREAEKEEEEAVAAATIGQPSANTSGYQAQAQFNRFTGKFQQAGAGPEMHNDENKSHRQMSAFFDVNAAANSHDGRSLKAERRGKTLTKKELQAFKEKRHQKKEEKRRAWLRD